MPALDLYNQEREKVGQVELPEEVFAVKPQNHLLYEAVKWQLACRRKGTASTKSRGQVRGGGRKPWRQKGTGRARAGSIRSPLRHGGGVIFGPKPRSYGYPLPKKVKRAALRSALALKLSQGKLMVVDRLELTEIKTRSFLEILSNMELNNALIVTERNFNLERSARNLPGFKVIRWEGLNTYDLLKYEQLLLTRQSVEKITQQLSV
ncbi:MAG: 50S ribosomal protein L4 [Deltaproteobacteria bacterium]|nr:MAG: 50S ribosomal protein L4 [Deltaproteobacteria bacterium]